MKVLQVVNFHLQYHQANSKKNTAKICEFVLNRFTSRFGKRDLASISQEGGPGISAFTDEKQQASHKAESIFSSGSLL